MLAHGSTTRAGGVRFNNAVAQALALKWGVSARTARRRVTKMKQVVDMPMDLSLVEMDKEMRQRMKPTQRRMRSIGLEVDSVVSALGVVNAKKFLSVYGGEILSELLSLVVERIDAPPSKSNDIDDMISLLIERKL